MFGDVGEQFVVEINTGKLSHAPGTVTLYQIGCRFRRR
jgi:hypothetical protein